MSEVCAPVSLKDESEQMLHDERKYLGFLLAQVGLLVHNFRSRLPHYDGKHPWTMIPILLEVVLTPLRAVSY